MLFTIQGDEKNYHKSDKIVCIAKLPKKYTFCFSSVVLLHMKPAHLTYEKLCHLKVKELHQSSNCPSKQFCLK